MKIYVGNLSRSTTEEGLEAAFAAFGAVRSVAIVKDRYTSEPRGFAFVEMDNQQEALAAIAGLNDKEIDNRTVNVTEARPRPEKGGRPHGGGFRDRRGR